MGNVDPSQFFAICFVIFFAIGLHEYAHCKVADMAGDPTPGIYGRVTLNLTKHFDPFGTVMMFISALSGYGIGWGKPAPINPKRMANPRWDTFAAVIAGPMTNFVQAIIYGLLFRVLIVPGVVSLKTVPGLIIFEGVLLNLTLCFFNLVPIAPLDGHWLIGQLLPDKQQYYWYKYSRAYGPFLLLGLVLMSQYMARQGQSGFLFAIIDKPVFYFFKTLTGLPLPTLEAF